MTRESPMVLSAPSYIARCEFQFDPLRYTWDDWDLDRAESPLDELLLTKLRTLSQRANVAFCIACSEWIAYPLCALLDDLFPLQRLEAAWAQVVDARYSLGLVASPDDWPGPLKRPVLRAVELVEFALAEMARDESPAEIAATSSRLAVHLLVDNAATFLDWQGSVVARLEEHFRLDPDDALGDVVPREALDPEHSFDAARTEALVNAFLERFCHSSNPFMCSSAEMHERGFKGSYCRFDQHYDRKLRFEW